MQLCYVRGRMTKINQSDLTLLLVQVLVLDQAQSQMILHDHPRCFSGIFMAYVSQRTLTSPRVGLAFGQ